MNETIMYYGPFVLLVCTILVLALIIGLIVKSKRKSKKLAEELELLKGNIKKES